MANLSKIKREKMLDYFEKIKEINNDDENIRAITEIENALNEKKYGIVRKLRRICTICQKKTLLN